MWFPNQGTHFTWFFFQNQLLSVSTVGYSSFNWFLQEVTLLVIRFSILFQVCGHSKRATLGCCNALSFVLSCICSQFLSSWQLLNFLNVRNIHPLVEKDSDKYNEGDDFSPYLFIHLHTFRHSTVGLFLNSKVDLLKPPFLACFSQFRLSSQISEPILKMFSFHFVQKYPTNAIPLTFTNVG